MAKAKTKDYVIVNGAWFNPETRLCVGVGGTVSFTTKQAKTYGESNLRLKTDDVEGDPTTEPTGEPQGTDDGGNGGTPPPEPAPAPTPPPAGAPWQDAE